MFERLFLDSAAVLVFGCIAAVVSMLFVYVLIKLLDWLTPGVKFETELGKGNIGVAILFGSTVLGVCYVVGSVVQAVLK